jgi:hypothetical protein
MKKLYEYPDLYAYFSDVFDVPKGFDLIAPDDPMQQVIVFIHILESFFYALRYVGFSALEGSDGELQDIGGRIASLTGNWHDIIERLLVKEYYSRLGEYCRILDSSSENRTSRYAVTTLGEAQWLKRLFFLPWFRFESMLATPPFRSKDMPKVFEDISELKSILMRVATEIEAANRMGGVSTGSKVRGLDNPWEPYLFQVPNPVSRRLDALIGAKKGTRKTNTALIFFTLSAVSVLDYLLNDKTSWAYLDREYYPFRSVDGAGERLCMV